MQTEQEIIENLRDAGCAADEIQNIIGCYRNGRINDTQKLIEDCRKQQVDRMHESQQCIARLDYLKYRMENG